MNTFDERAQDWDSDPAKVERAQIVAQAIRACTTLPTQAAGLEYGCGTGLLSFALREHLAHITLADTSEGMLKVLTEKIRQHGIPNMHPTRLDLASDPLPASRYHITYSLMVLHHIPNTAAILQQFERLLHPGGWLAIADLDEERGDFHAPGTTGIHYGFARPALQSLVQAAGFQNQHIQTIYTIHKEINAQKRAFPVFLLCAQKPL